jgi:shikimate kinase
MSRSRPIIITGFMGSGKTTVARELGRELGCVVADLDELIMEHEQRSPKEIIEQDGEDKFREVETQMLSTLLAEGAARVIGAGGGAWTLRRNRDLISEHSGLAVWLDAPFELCWQRIKAGGGRPLAREKEQARRLYAERRELYALAQLHIQVTTKKSADDLSREIAEALRVQGI